MSAEEVHVREEITLQQRTQLVDLLNEHRAAIAKNLHDTGKTDIIEMDIKGSPDAVPIYCKPYKTSQIERATIKEIVTGWKEKGIATETTSLYASPVL